MIEINLLPEELKGRARAKKTVAGVEIRYLPYLIPLFVFGLLICAHLSLAALFIIKGSQLHSLNKRWRSLEPQRKVLDEFNKEYAIMSEDAMGIRKFAQERMNWAEKLNKLSLCLPSGIWFNELSTAPVGLTLQGTVISLQKEEIGLIKKFIDSLKSEAVFSKDFDKIELVSAKKRTVGGYEIFDFVLTGAAKSAIDTRPEKPAR